MTDIITSPQNPRIKAVAELREARARRESGLILIDGVREIGRAVDAGVELQDAYVCDELARSDSAREVAARLRESGVAVTAVSSRVYEKIAYGERGDGVVVVAQRPRRGLGDAKVTSMSLVAVIDGLEKPGNIGAIARSADGAGVSAIVVTDPACDAFGPNAIRASTGVIFSLPVIEASQRETAAWLVSGGFQIVAARPDAETLCTAVDYRKPTAIVLGSESMGLSSAWSEGVLAARVPMKGRADSLNVSVTAALFFYEALRQRS